MEEIIIIESKPVTVKIMFCSEVDVDGMIWYYTKFSNSKYLENGGSYTKEVAYQRYLNYLQKYTFS